VPRYLLEMRGLHPVEHLYQGMIDHPHPEPLCLGMIGLHPAERLCLGTIDRHHPDGGGMMILLPDHRQGAGGKAVRHRGGARW
jgi:hypothetical protein